MEQRWAERGEPGTWIETAVPCTRSSSVMARL
jgi:hypothetical protein